MSSVRSDFIYSIQMKHEPEFEELMAWFEAEKSSPSMEDHIFTIADTVISGRRYLEDEKISMISRKATTVYNFAKQQSHTDPDAAVRGFRDSLNLHLRAFKQNALVGSSMLSISEKYARDTAHQWFRMLSTAGKWEPLAAVYDLEKDCEGYLDPISDPLISYLDKLAKGAWFPAEKARTHSLARKLFSHGFDSRKWMDTTVLPRIKSSLSSFIAETGGR